ncbi:ABC transporter permease [Cryobacterium sp. TMT3-29-2]|uniref:ABC transporter permease n=1 Tax=Cryobacterium sp. TMT3-29-2 TaxID=2555867 RepID=UPI001073E8DF|nr:ABC transporter permease [Cryobacterium sp. TMT3-29-2]TFC83760.1 ABC transporter permease [Cryobacterium sp. TMT3-29-2]
MIGFAAFAQKEILEIVRTWRVWVLPGILLFFALTGPIMARFTPEIIHALASEQLGNFTLPDPSYVDAYTGWIKNLSQTALFALIIVYGSIVSSERRSGTAILVLTKPVSRGSFILAKATVHSAFLAVLVVIGTAVTWGLTAVVFEEAPGPALWSAALAWLAFGILFIALMTLLSVLIAPAAGAAGAGLGAYALISIASLWTPLGRWSPAGLTTIPTSLALGEPVDAFWPVCTALLLAAALFALAAAAFQRNEL